MNTIEILMDDYISMLEDRKEFVEEKFGWRVMPDCVWNYLVQLIEDCGIGKPEHASPSYVVDNAVVNGDWGDFDEYKHTKKVCVECDADFDDYCPDCDCEESEEREETDEEFIERVEDDVMAIFPDERIVIYSI